MTFGFPTRSTKNLTSVTILWKLTCYDLWVSQNFQEKPNFSGSFIKGFSQPPCLFLFLEQTADSKIDLLFLVLRYLAQCTDLEILPEPYLKCTPLKTENLYFYETGVTYTIFDFLKETEWMLFQTFADNYCYVVDFLLYIPSKYKYWCIQKGLCDIVQPLDIYQKCSFSTWSLIVKSQCVSVHGVYFD